VIAWISQSDEASIAGDMDLAPHGMTITAMAPLGMTTMPMATECWDALCLVQALLMKVPQIVITHDIDVSGCCSHSLHKDSICAEGPGRFLPVHLQIL